jgi:trans-2-enoyl-CoA reductase
MAYFVSELMSYVLQVEGVYGVKAKFPMVGGNEGVAEVISVGDDVESLSVGDRVVTTMSASGTWATEGILPAKGLIKVDPRIPVAYASSLLVNPGTSYRMLRDFVDLKPGDCIIQNGANSMVGLGITQMAREMGVTTINVVRADKPSWEKATNLIHNLGGDVACHDGYLGTPEFNEILKDLPPIKLALNCVGGQSATELARCLAPGGTIVTYGGMSKQPLSLPHDLVTYKQINMKGFWMAAWKEQATEEQIKEMVDDISKMILDKQLAYFFEMVDLDDFEWALNRHMTPFNLRKIVLTCDFPDRFAEHDAKDQEEAYEHFDYPTVLY